MRSGSSQAADAPEPGKDDSAPHAGFRGTIADVSSPDISDSLRVVIGDAIAPKAAEPPPVEVKKPKKGLLGGLFGSGKTKAEVRAVGLAAILCSIRARSIVLPALARTVVLFRRLDSRLNYS